jgi:hypothetical protein
MNKQNTITNIGLILMITHISCKNKRDIDCGYNGGTIQVITDQNASVRQVDNQIFLYFQEGIKIDSPYLQDTIHLLFPCNLQAQFKLNSQKVRVSGEIKENPGYSSHNNYTDLYINKITIEKLAAG